MNSACRNEIGGVASKAKKSSNRRPDSRLKKTDLIELANYLYSRYDTKYRDKLNAKKDKNRDTIKDK